MSATEPADPGVNVGVGFSGLLIALFVARTALEDQTLLISGMLVQAVTFCVRSLPLEFPVVKGSLLFSQAYGTIGEGFGSVFTRSRGWL